VRCAPGVHAASAEAVCSRVPVTARVLDLASGSGAFLARLKDAWAPLKAARIFYKSRIKPDSLAVAYRTALEANGWRHVSSTTSASKGTTQVYEKQDSSLQVLIYEGWYYTWTEVSTTRITGRPTATPAPR